MEDFDTQPRMRKAFFCGQYVRPAAADKLVVDDDRTVRTRVTLLMVEKGSFVPLDTVQ